jgi:hypothetical protein
MKLNKDSQHREWKRANKIRHGPEERIVKTAMEHSILGEQTRWQHCGDVEYADLKVIL